MAEKTQIPIVEEPKRKGLIQACYGIIGCMQEVHNQLGPGLPEYTFGYLRGTGWPIAILVNFGTSPKAQIERYHYNNGTIELF